MDRETKITEIRNTLQEMKEGRYVFDKQQMEYDLTFLLACINADSTVFRVYNAINEIREGLADIRIVN